MLTFVQLCSKVGTALWKVICSAYKNKDLKALRAANQELLELLEDLETLLASHEYVLLFSHARDHVVQQLSNLCSLRLYDHKQNPFFPDQQRRYRCLATQIQ